MDDVDRFIAHFNFRHELSLMVGVERECHLTDSEGRIAPLAPQVLRWMWSSLNGRGKCYGYELSSCQFEDKFAEPVDVYRVENELLRHEQEILTAEHALDFRRVFHGVAPEDMPLDIYPDERYLRITKDMPEAVLRAACRVAGVHVHIGMPDHLTALRVYNEAIKHLPELYELGFTDTGDRLGLYREVVHGGMVKSERIRLFEQHLCTAPEPPHYDSWDQFYERAVREGFSDDPRRLWDFIRISKHGTIEFRVFDTTEDADLIADWAEVCHDLCRQAM